MTEAVLAVLARLVELTDSRKVTWTVQLRDGQFGSGYLRLGGFQFTVDGMLQTASVSRGTGAMGLGRSPELVAALERQAATSTQGVSLTEALDLLSKI